MNTSLKIIGWLFVAWLYLIICSVCHSACLCKPCLTIKVYDPNAEPVVGEYYTNVELSFTSPHGSHPVFIVNDVVNDWDFDAVDLNTLLKTGTCIGNIPQYGENYMQVGPISSDPNKLSTDPNIIWADGTKSSTVIINGTTIEDTEPVYRTSMIVVNDFAGTGLPGFGLCFFDCYKLSNLEVLLTLNSGRTCLFVQEDEKLVYQQPAITPIYYKNGTSLIYHLKSCRFYKETSTPITDVTGLRPCKICLPNSE